MQVPRITRSQVMDACRAVGLDPEVVSELHMKGDELEARLYLSHQGPVTVRVPIEDDLRAWVDEDGNVIGKSRVAVS